MNYHNLVNLKFGKLIVIKRAKDRYTKSNNKVIYYLCKCECGNNMEIRGVSLTRRDRPTTNCGCVRRINMSNLKKDKNYNWKGGKRVESGGYVEVYAPENKLSRKNGYIKEHRLIMEEKIGRPLLKEENVHHIDGNKLNNKIENLELWNTSQPCGQRVEDKIKWAKEILEIYG